MSKNLLKSLALLIPIALLISSASPAMAVVQRIGQPRIDDSFMRVISNPDAATAAFQACEVEFLPDMIRWANVRKLTLENQVMVAAPGYHYCYIAFNCRSYVPDDAEQPDAGRPLAPLNWTAFRQGMLWAGLSHAEKEAAILQIYGGPIVTAVDSPVPPALGVWHWEPPEYPGCNYTKAWEIMSAAGFTIVANQLVQPNGVVARDEIEVLSPNTAPTSIAFTQKFVDKWNDFMDNFLLVTNVNFYNNPVDFGGELVPRAFTYRNFDAYFLCWSLGRFPDYLYDFFHSSQDYPDSNNAPGVVDAELDGYLEELKWGTVYEDKLQACYDAQERLVFDLCPTVELYSRTYFTAFKNYTAYGGEDKYLANAINQKGLGADQGWTWNLMHWSNAPIGGTVNYVLGANLVNLHPGWATSAYEWDLLNRLFDGLMGTDLEMADTPGCAAAWSVEPFVWEPLNVYEGQKVRFQLREGLLWQTGVPVTVRDIQFALEFLPNFPRYGPIYEYLLWSQIVDPCTIDIYLNTTSQFILYDLAGVSLLFPEHIYGENGWLVAHGEDPVNCAPDTILTDYMKPAGTPPLLHFAGDQHLTALVGCGPYIFDYWDPSTSIAHIVKNPTYWVDVPVKAYIIQPQRVDPCATFEYSIVLFNQGTKDAVTGELVPFVIDYVEVTMDGAPIFIIPGPIVLPPFAWIVLGPYEMHFDKGMHTLDVHVYEVGVPGVAIDNYVCPTWITIPQDVSLDFYVGIDDIFAAASAFGSQPPPFPGYERWDERCDMNTDYYIGIDDIFSIATKFGWDA